MAMNVGGISAFLDLDTGKFNTKLQGAQKDIDSFAGKMGSAGQKISAVGSTMTKGVTLPLVGVGTAALKVGMDFEAGMSEVAALSGATGSDLAKLEGVAREMGATTKYSATEASEALKYMALAGWDTEQMAAGLGPSLYLAGAAGMELGTATDIVTDTMSMFGMEAQEATKMTDMLAYAQANSNTDVEQLGEALKYSGAAANAMGYDLADTVAILGTFADQGLKGSAAGTTMTAMFRDMKKATKDGAMEIGEHSVAVVDAEGNYRDMAEILADVEFATKDMTVAERDAALGAIFGTQAIKGVNMVMEAGTDTLKEFEGGIRDSDGAAKDMYDTMQDNLKGSIDEMKSALEEAGLALSETLIPMVRSAAEWVTKLAGKFSALSPETQENIVKFGLLAAAIGPTLVLIGKVATGVGALAGLFSTITGALATVTSGTVAAAGATGTLAGGFGTALAVAAPWVVGLGLIGGAIYAVAKNLSEDAIPEVQRFPEEVSESTQQAVGAFLDLEEQATTALNQLTWSGQTVTKELKDSMMENYTEMAAIISEGLDEAYEQNIESMQGYVMESKMLTDEEKQDIIAKTEETYIEKQMKLEEGQAKINEILQRAVDENREITRAEQVIINGIQQEMKVNGVQILSDGKVESQAILEQLRQESGNITRQQAVEVIQNSYEQKEETVKNAQDQAAETIENIIRQRDETGEISEEQARKLIDEAIRQKDNVVREAEQQHENVVKEAKAQHEDIGKYADETTGELKSKWQVITETVSSKAKEAKEKAVKNWQEMKEDMLKESERKKSALASDWKELVSNITTKAKEAKDKVVTSWKNMRQETVAENEAQRLSLTESWNETKQAVIDKAEELKTNAVQKFEEMKTATTAKMEEMKTATTQKAAEIGSAIIEKFESIVGRAREVGSNIVNAVSDGMDSAKKWAVSKAEGVGNAISNGFKRVLEIFSPSRVFVRHGENIPLGAAKGIKNKQAAAVKAAEEMGKKIISEFDRLEAATITALKRRYNEELSIATNHLNKKIRETQNAADKELRIWEEQHRKRLGLIDQEVSEAEKALQAQIDEINGKTKAEDKAIKEQEYQQAIADKKKQIAEAKDNKERVKLQEELNKMKAQKQREELLEARQKQIEALQLEMQEVRKQGQLKKEQAEIEYQQKLESQRVEHEATIQHLESELKATQEHYAYLLDEERIQAEARRLILDQNNKELIELLETYYPAWQDAGRSFGQELLDGLQSMKQSIKNEVESILSLVNQAKRASASVSNENSIIRSAQSDWQEANRRGDEAGKTAAHERAEDARKRGGTIANKAQGSAYFKGGYTWVGEQGRELVKLPKGTEIKSNTSSERLAGKDRSIVQNITIQSPEALNPSEIKRKQLQASRELAMEWGV